MAINFEAANMAGYNNPKIEVFKAAVSDDQKVTAPNKSILINCINRGSIPIIMLGTNSAGYILHLNSWEDSIEGTALDFSTLSGASALPEIALQYYANSDTPKMVMG